MNRYIETMQLLENEPQKWLAQRSVPHVNAFLSGFHLISTLGGVNLDALTPLCNGFAQFLEARHGGYPDYSPEAALYERGYDDEEAFSMYFQDWHAFLEQWTLTSRFESIGPGARSTIHMSGFFNQVRLRVEMYFPGPSIQQMYSLIRGLQHSRDCYTPGARIEPDFRDYEKWFSERAPLKKLCRWDRLLLAESGFNEQAAFTRFFETLEEFRVVSRPGNAD